MTYFSACSYSSCIGTDCHLKGCFANRKKSEDSLLTKPENFGQFIPEASNKRPHKCPVCNGSGVKTQTLSSGHSSLDEKCRACKGACVLWG